ncbi:unnamed protein product [Clavelina lepadiformis]|uniref:G-patch domain-containing protein n=1 Tax=Clavelina lepadiformis TaxID=159417 RepID=A0ABP0FUH4_CLALP
MIVRSFFATDVATSPASPAGALVPDVVRWLKAVNLHMGSGLGKGLGREGGVGVGFRVAHGRGIGQRAA